MKINILETIKYILIGLITLAVISLLFHSIGLLFKLAFYVLILFGLYLLGKHMYFWLSGKGK